MYIPPKKRSLTYFGKWQKQGRFWLGAKVTFFCPDLLHGSRMDFFFPAKLFLSPKAKATTCFTENLLTRKIILIQHLIGWKLVLARFESFQKSG
jgi:hypothetical protein